MDAFLLLKINKTKKKKQRIFSRSRKDARTLKKKKAMFRYTSLVLSSFDDL